jgi:hypothetical protein
MDDIQKAYKGGYLMGLLDAGVIVTDEGEACLNDVVEGDIEGARIMNWCASVLLTVAHDIKTKYYYVKESENFLAKI